MTSDSPNPRPARQQLMLIFAVFAVPLLVAVLMYYGGGVKPAGTQTNKGALLLPIISLAEAVADSPVHELSDNQWLMVYANDGACTDQCRGALYRLRQARLMLGKDMGRVVRVFLHGESAPDTVFLEEQHAGLKTMKDKNLEVLLMGKRPAAMRPGGCYLIDPLGNLVMYFPPDLDPKAMVDDIKHLLRLSHIG